MVANATLKIRVSAMLKCRLLLPPAAATFEPVNAAAAVKGNH